MIIIMLGAPGSGKGTQASMLNEKYGIKQFSMGDMIRKEVSQGTRHGMACLEATRQGKLVSNDIVFDIIDKNFAELIKGGIIFDGFPRNIRQVEFLSNQLTVNNVALSKVFYIRVSDELIIDRILARFSCKECGTIYSAQEHADIEACIKCAGKEFISRSDDNIDTVNLRLQEYRDETYPIIDYYATKLPDIFYEVDGEKTSQDVFKSICANL